MLLDLHMELKPPHRADTRFSAFGLCFWLRFTAIGKKILQGNRWLIFNFPKLSGTSVLDRKPNFDYSVVDFSKAPLFNAELLDILHCIIQMISEHIRMISFSKDLI